MTPSVVALSTTYPRLSRAVHAPSSIIGGIGDHVLFYIRALSGVPYAGAHYRREVVRLVANCIFLSSADAGAKAIRHCIRNSFQDPDLFASGNLAGSSWRHAACEADSLGRPQPLAVRCRKQSGENAPG